MRHLFALLTLFTIGYPLQADTSYFQADALAPRPSAHPIRTPGDPASILSILTSPLILPNMTETELSDRYKSIQIDGNKRHTILKGQVTHGRPVVIKIARETNGLEHEIRILRALFPFLSNVHHPPVPRLVDFGQIQYRFPFVVMEHISTLSLTDWVETATRLSLPQIFQTMELTLTATRWMHEQGFSHGDIKPDNIFPIYVAGYPVAHQLIDVESADFHHPLRKNRSRRAYTLRYGAPEVQAGNPADLRSDVYSLGLVLSFLMDFYFEEQNAMYRGLERIVIKAVSSKPEQRYADAIQFLEELSDLKTNPVPKPAILKQT